VPVLVQEVAYDGAAAKISRLGLTELVQEVRDVLTSFRLEVEESKDANGGAAVREMVDAAFSLKGGWTKTVSGGVDWRKCREVDGVRLCVGVEVQISARSDLLVIDVIHLRDALEAGTIDVAVIVVPSNELAVFLPDRAPSLSAAERHVRAARAETLPIVVIPFSHDGAGAALPKKRTNQGKLPEQLLE
jgi:hypothetical protein